MATRSLRLLGSEVIGLAGACLWLASLGPPALGAPGRLPFTVNNSVDLPDLHPGDGVCEAIAHSNTCTLRAAVQEANASPGPDTIELQANTTYNLTQKGGLPDTPLIGDLDITDSVTILGAGPDSTIIDGNGGFT